MNNRLIKITAGAAAAVAIAFGGMAIAHTGSGSSAAATGGGPGMRGGTGGPPNGFPGGGRPGGGAAVTGTAADKVKAAVLAKYSGATIERIIQLPDGSYAAHSVTGNSDTIVLVSKSFVVTGTAQPGPRPGAMPPSGGTPPTGAPQAPSSSSGSQQS
jgi:hypothetical protein